MKIGIITYWDSKDNYGQQLQLFALYEKLKEIGHSPFLIKYDGSCERRKINFWAVFNPYKVLSKIRVSFARQKIDESIIQPSRHFDEFRNKYIDETDKVYSIFDLRNNPPVADMYITGSDQVWRTECPGYYLDFGDSSIKRISYAASFGLSEFPQSVLNTKQKLLLKINHISVRENTGVELCKKMQRNDAVKVVDPTVLFRSDYYSKKFNLHNTKERYLLLYLLGDVQGVNIDDIYNFAQKRNLKIKYVDTHGQNNEKEKIYPSIEEWLELVCNASFIVTNSFHGTVFSVLFHKRFCTIPKGFSDDRLYSLLTPLGLNDNIFCNNLDECIDRENDFKKADDIIENDRKLSLEFLSNCLNHD